MKKEYITIVFRNGETCNYKPEEYTDYRYDGKYFIVIRDKQWIGFYNLECVGYIEVNTIKNDEDANNSFINKHLVEFEE